MENKYMVGICAGIAIAGMSVTHSEAMVNKTAEVTASSLNLRSLKDHRLKIGSLFKGDKVTVLEDLGDGFVRVKTSRGLEGKCSKAYLKVMNSSNTNSVSTGLTVKKKVMGTDTLNVRSGPGTSYSKVGSIARGAVVEVLESKGGWNKIKYNNGKVGYCSGSYLGSISNTTASNANTTILAKKKVAGTDTLNVRSGPGTSYSKVGSIARGAVVEVLESKGGWAKIKYNNGKVGYCSESYLTSTSNSTNTSTNQGATKKYNNVVSAYTTYYGTGSNRAKNIELAARRVNGTVIKPGQTFSYKKAIGETSIENGYLSAPIMANGQISDNGIGGGVCQLSSTVYAAALEAGLTKIESRTHTGKVGYMPAGVDAVISSAQDLKITNTYKEDIVIYVTASGGKLTVKFSSVNPLLGGKRYVITTEAISGSKQTKLKLVEKKGIFSKVVYTRTSKYVR